MVDLGIILPCTPSSYVQIMEGGVRSTEDEVHRTVDFQSLFRFVGLGIFQAGTPYGVRGSGYGVDTE